MLEIAVTGGASSVVRTDFVRLVLVPELARVAGSEISVVLAGGEVLARLEHDNRGRTFRLRVNIG